MAFNIDRMNNIRAVAVYYDTASNSHKNKAVQRIVKSELFT